MYGSCHHDKRYIALFIVLRFNLSISSAILDFSGLSSSIFTAQTRAHTHKHTSACNQVVISKTPLKGILLCIVPDSKSVVR